MISFSRTPGRGTRLTRTAQIGFVCVLTLCVLQTIWWVADQAFYTADMRDRLSDLYDHDVEAARELGRRGATLAEVRAAFPQLGIIERDGALAIDTSYRERLEAERRRHLFQYGSEGAFFILVLVAGIWVIGQTLAQRRDLLRRQQNFVAAVSHELKNPLASLKLSAETLELRPADDEKRKALAGRMLREVDRLESLVSNLLAVARLDEGEMRLTKERVELSRMLHEILDGDPFHAKEHGVDVTLDVADHLVVSGDARAVHAVLANLADNAVKSVVASGGGRVDVRAHVEGDAVRVDVEDDGLGFDAGQQAQLFTKFYRTGEELRRKTKGAGLGLYIVKQFVELEGGRVEAASDGPGRGARFTVWWPVPARGAGEEAA